MGLVVRFDALNKEKRERYKIYYNTRATVLSGSSRDAVESEFTSLDQSEGN